MMTMVILLNLPRIQRDRETGLITSRVTTYGYETLVVNYGKEITVEVTPALESAEVKTYTYDKETGKFMDGENEVELAGNDNEELLKKAEAIIKGDVKANNLAEEVGTTPNERAIFEQNRKDVQAQQAYDLTWKLLNGILGSFAYNYIDSMCIEEDPEDRAAEGSDESDAVNETA
jgi:hypothetical protein